MRSTERQVTPLALTAIFVAVTTVTALKYAFLPGEATLAARRSFHANILDHSGPSPDRYRFVVPMMLEVPIGLLQRSLPRSDAFKVCCSIAATIPIAMRANEYGAYSFLEPMFVALALLCILRRRRLWLALLVFVAA
ncbi:MAG: hypothetical protein ACM36C_03040 [Acidobacteriota bacterium]